MSKDDECLSYTEILNGMRKACIPKPKVKCLFGNINLKKDGIVEAIDKKKAFPTTATSGLWLTSGKWYFEVELIKSGRAQIGWVTPSFEGSGVLSSFGRGKGVGDDRFGWAFDGSRRKSWHASKSKRYGTEWKDGDVVGCAVDLTASSRRVMFSLNGSFEAPMGEMDLSNCKSAMMYLRPAVSSTRFVQFRFLLSSGIAKYAPPAGFRFFDEAYRHRHSSVYKSLDPSKKSDSCEICSVPFRILSSNSGDDDNSKTNYQCLLCARFVCRDCLQESCSEIKCCEACVLEEATNKYMDVALKRLCTENENFSQQQNEEWTRTRSFLLALGRRRCGSRPDFLSDDEKSNSRRPTFRYKFSERDRDLIVKALEYVVRVKEDKNIKQCRMNLGSTNDSDSSISLDILSLSDLESKKRDFYESDVTKMARFVAVPFNCDDDDDNDDSNGKEGRITSKIDMRKLFRRMGSRDQKMVQRWKLGVMSLSLEKWRLSFESNGLKVLSLKRVTSFEIKDELNYASITFIFDSEKQTIRVTLKDALIWRKRIQDTLNANHLKSSSCSCSYDDDTKKWKEDCTIALTESSVSINELVFELNRVSDICVVDARAEHWSFIVDETQRIHVKMTAQDSTASWVVALGSAVASSMLTKSNRNDEEEESSNNISSSPDFLKLYTSFSSQIPEVANSIQKVEYSSFDFVSSAVFVQNQRAVFGSLCLVDGVLVLAPSYISGYFKDVRDVSSLCTSSKMLTKHTTRRKSLLELFSATSASKHLRISSQELQDDENDDTETMMFKKVEEYTTSLPCHFCHQIANSKSRLCKECGVPYCNTHKKAFMIKSERRVWACKECPPPPEENIWIVLTPSLKIHDRPEFKESKTRVRTLAAGQKVRAMYWPDKNGWIYLCEDHQRGWIPQRSKDVVHVARPGSEAHVKFASTRRGEKERKADDDETTTNDNDEVQDFSKKMMPCMEFSNVKFSKHRLQRNSSIHSRKSSSSSSSNNNIATPDWIQLWLGSCRSQEATKFHSTFTKYIHTCRLESLLELLTRVTASAAAAVNEFEFLEDGVVTSCRRDLYDLVCLLKQIEECRSSLEISREVLLCKDSFLQRKIESLQPQLAAAMHLLDHAILHPVAEGASKEVLDMSTKSSSKSSSKSFRGLPEGFTELVNVLDRVEYFRDLFVKGIVRSESMRKISSKCQRHETSKEEGIRAWFAFLKTLLRYVAAPSSKTFAGGALVFEETWHVELALLLALVPVTETHIDNTVKDFEVGEEEEENVEENASSALQRMSIRFGRKSKPTKVSKERIIRISHHLTLQVRALYSVIEQTKQFETFLQNFFEDPRFHNSNFRVPNFQGQLLKCFDKVVAPIYRGRAKTISGQIDKISLSCSEIALNGDHKVFAELDPVFHDVLDLIKRASEHGPGLPLLGVLQELTMTPPPSVIDDEASFGALHNYASILSRRILKIGNSKKDNEKSRKIDRLLVVCMCFHSVQRTHTHTHTHTTDNSATGAVKYVNSAKDVVQDTLEDQADAFEVYGPFGFSGLGDAFMNVCTESRKTIIECIKSEFWTKINEKEYVDMYTSEKKVHIMTSVCNSIERDISKVKASLVSYSFTVYLPFMHNLADSILRSFISFLEDVVSPLRSSNSIDRAILDVLDLAAFLKDLPTRCSHSPDLEARCEAMFEKRETFKNALERYGNDRVLKPVLLIQKILTMSKSSDVLKTKSNLISAFGFHFPEFVPLFSLLSQGAVNCVDEKLRKLLKTSLHMLLRFRGEDSYIGSDARKFVRSVCVSLLSEADDNDGVDDTK